MVNVNALSLFLMFLTYSEALRAWNDDLNGKWFPESCSRLCWSCQGFPIGDKPTCYKKHLDRLSESEKKSYTEGPCTSGMCVTYWGIRWGYDFVRRLCGEAVVKELHTIRQLQSSRLGPEKLKHKLHRDIDGDLAHVLCDSNYCNDIG